MTIFMKPSSSGEVTNQMDLNEVSGLLLTRKKRTSIPTRR
jgi:hypothetical protein